MNNQTPRLSESAINRTRNAILVISAYLAGSVIAGSYLAYYAIKNPSWQLWTAMFAFIAMVVSSIVALIVVRRDRLELGVWSVIIVSYIAALVITIAISGMSALLLVSSVFLSSMVAIQTLKSRQAPMIIAGFVVGIVVLFTDLFVTTTRISVPGLQTLVYIFVPLMLVLFSIVILRQFRNYSLRTKLILVFAVVVVTSVGVVAFLDNRNSRAALTNSADEKLLSAASQTATRLDDLIATNLSIVRTEAEATEELAAFLEAHASGQSTDEEALTLASILRSFADRDPQSITSYALLDSKGLDVADTFTADIGVDKSNREYFQAPITTGQPYVSPITLSPTRPGDSDLYFSSPVYGTSGGIVGVLRFSYSTKSLQDLVIQANGLAGSESFAVLLDENYIRLAHGTSPDLVLKSVVPLDSALLAELQAAGRLPSGTAEELSSNLPDLEASLKNMETQPVFVSASAALAGSAAETAVVRMKTQPWIIYFRQPQDVFLAPIVAQTRTTLLLAVLITLLATGVAAGLAQVLVAPITNLTVTARKIAAGDLNVQARIESEDETGTLARTFNSMTAQLGDLVDTLESRVAERTHSLELAADVGRSISQVRALDVMLKDAAEIIRSRFDLYYTQVYLTDPGQRNLILEAGTGEVGVQLLEREHSLPLNTGSINGRAAVEKRSVVISDTAASAAFRQNPLLPDTRGEMAIPLIVGDRVVGVLDMQSSQPDVLTDEVLPAFEALAGQLAVAIQNANLLAETEHARAEMEKQAARLTRTSWDQHLDAIHRPEQIGFMFNRQEIIPLAEVEESQLSENEHSISAPIAVSGETLGSLVIELEDEIQSEQTSELVNIVARQVAQQLENLRLLENAERYRSEAEQAARLQTIEGWREYISMRAGGGLGYLYDIKEVRPQNDGDDLSEDKSALTLPVKARSETVGKLSVQGLMPEDQESIELAGAVAERLGAHIENLRLFEETRRGQLELERRARQLAAVAQISTASSQELEVQKMLATVVHLTQRQFGLYHAHVFIYEEETEELRIMACGWKEGDEHEGMHGTTSIPIAQEQSLVARAARSMQAVLINDVLNDPNWLPNPMLPDTRAELAVPLLISDRLLGVLDVQSDVLNAFTQEDANIQLTLASQIAIALQNAYSFAQAQKQAERESMLNIINQKIQSATTVEEVLQVAARELGHALGAPMTVAQLSIKDQN